MKHFFAIFLIAMVFSECTSSQTKSKDQQTQNTNTVSPKPVATAVRISTQIADASSIMQRKQIPILCYHHIKDWTPNEKSSLKLLLVPINNFKDQIKSLADSGYHTVTPDEYYAYLTTGAPLPSKPLMITFDDTDEDQYTIGAAELNKYGFKGVFFIMTISIGKPHYMSTQQIKELSDQGHVIAAHTWDHQAVTKLKTQKDYDVELLQPKHKLESITGKKIDYFAYPYGVIDPKIYTELEKDGYKSAYQLTEYKRDSTYPLYTIRRIMVPGAWNGTNLQKWLKVDFHS